MIVNENISQAKHERLNELGEKALFNVCKYLYEHDAYNSYALELFMAHCISQAIYHRNIHALTHDESIELRERGNDQFLKLMKASMEFGLQQAREEYEERKKTVILSESKNGL